MSEQKHILFLVSSLNEGGAERVASLLCDYWVENNYKVTLMPTYSGRGETFHPINDSVQISFLSDILGSTKNNLWNRIKRFLLLRKFILDKKPDLIISFLAQVNVTAILSSLGTGIPVIVSERTYPPQYQIGFIWTTLRKILYSRASAIVMQTSQGLDWVTTQIPRGKGYVIPNPILYPVPDSDPFIETKSVVDDEKKICLAVGRFVEYKHFKEIVIAFSGVAEEFRNWELVFLGDGSERENLEKEAEYRGLQKRIHFPGRAGNLDDWYKRANLFVLSSRFEGFPNALLEAMAYGVPCISVDCDTGPRDIISSGENGLLIPQGSTENLIQAMKSLMQDHDLAKTYGRSARKATENFSIEAIGLKWDSLIYSCLKDPEE